MQLSYCALEYFLRAGCESSCVHAVVTSLLSLRCWPSAFTRLTHARVNFPAMCAAVHVLPENCDVQFNPPCSSLRLFIDAVLSAGLHVWVLRLVNCNKGRNEGESARFDVLGWFHCVVGRMTSSFMKDRTRNFIFRVKLSSYRVKQSNCSTQQSKR